MIWRWARTARSNQSVFRSRIAGNVIQISNNDGDILIDADSARFGESSSPGDISVSPPVEHIGRPIYGRKDLIDQLVRVVKSPDDHSVNVLCGPGGCGKSTLAMLLASSASEDGVDVWWISAASTSTLHAGMRQLAVTLGVPQGRLMRAWSGRESATDLLWDFLKGHPKKWLLIIDAVDDPSVLAASTTTLNDGNGWARPPIGSQGSVVITSRDGSAKSWPSWCVLHPVGMLSPRDATAVLTEYAGDHGGSSHDAENLAVRLGGLPLALRLAGTYIKSNTRVRWPGAIATYGEYLRALDAHIGEVFPELDEEFSVFNEREARELVGCTWELSLTMLDQRGLIEARPLLQLLSHFADAPIPATLLHAEVLSQAKIAERIDARRLREVVEALADLGLVDLRNPPHEASNVESYGPSLTLHPLVRDVGRYPRRLCRPRIAYVSAVTLMVARSVTDAPSPDWTTWPVWEALAIHAFHALERSSREPGLNPVVIDAASYSTFHSAQFLMNRGEFEQAMAQQILALDALRRIAGDEHPGTLAIRHDLAVSLGRLGRLPEAEQELRSIASQKSETFGATAKETLASIHAHADVLWQQGELAKAEEGYRLILSVFEASGRYNYNTLGTHNNLIQVLVEQGKNSEADTEVERLLDRAESENLQGTTVAQARFSRARVRMAQARYDEAIAELREIVDEHASTLGERHPTTLATVHELGVALQDSGDNLGACENLRPVFVARTKAQGSSHHETLATRHQLALALHGLGKREEAEAHYRATLSHRIKVLGDRHLSTLATRFQLAVLLEEAGNFEDAEAEFLHVLIEECGAIGADHPSTLTTRMRLVGYMLRRGQLPEALAEVDRVLAARRRVLGEAHPITRETEGLAKLLRSVTPGTPEG